MDTTSSFGSRSRSSGSPMLFPAKPEPQETPPGRHTCSGGIVINEPDASSHLVKSKTEPGHLPIKQEHLAMSADD
ncbi:SEC12-like protein 2 [Hordeum vulgare]|nr:SEC12-like protein 2 [Hordeum vulgare]